VLLQVVPPWGTICSIVQGPIKFFFSPYTPSPQPHFNTSISSIHFITSKFDIFLFKNNDYIVYLYMYPYPIENIDSSAPILLPLSSSPLWKKRKNSKEDSPDETQQSPKETKSPFKSLFKILTIISLSIMIYQYNTPYYQ